MKIDTWLKLIIIVLITFCGIVLGTYSNLNGEPKEINGLGIPAIKLFEDMRQQIKECERPLPRTEECDIVITTRKRLNGEML